MMKTQALVDELTDRLNAVIVEAETFEEQRIITNLYVGLKTPGTKIVIARENSRPVFFFIGGAQRSE